MTINWSGVSGGKIYVDDLQLGNGALRFWSDAKKTSQVKTIDALGNQGTVTVYVEGIHESRSAGDVAVHLTYTTSSNVVLDFFSQRVTVTPIVESFTGTPPPGQSVYFTNTYAAKVFGNNPNAPEDGSGGMWASGIGPNNKDLPGIAFRADVTTGGLPDMSMNFAQNMTAWRNGVNTRNAGYGWTFQQQQPPNPRLVPYSVTKKPQYQWAPYPMLDALQGQYLYGYGEHPVVPRPNGVIVETEDSPRTGTPKLAGIVQEEDLGWTNLIDLREEFRMHLVIAYSDGSIYPVAALNWSVNFWGDTRGVNQQGVGVGPTVNRDPQGVRAGPYGLSNEDPWTGEPVVLPQAHSWYPMQ
jgi:hypothetical protein